jgi:AcrR family transcriptional regulator
MEAASPSISDIRELPSDKAGRIIEAMRASVAERGFAGSTFEHVAREAGVSRGLLHYYFGSKERLLIEAVRRECRVRDELLDRSVADATSADEVLAGLLHTLEDVLGEGPSAVIMFHEMLTLAQRNGEIAGELAELGRRTREHLAEVLRTKARAGVLALKADPETAASFLLALADGILVRRLTEPDLEIVALMSQSAAVARELLGSSDRLT